MKRSWLFIALLAGGMILYAPVEANSASRISESALMELPCDFTPRQVRAILRATHQQTGIPMRRLVRKYLNGSLTMERLTDGTVKVTIFRAGGDVLVAIILVDI